MKVTYHIPTEQFGFVEIETEAVPSDLGIISYEDIKASVMPQNASGEGLDQKTWNTALDGYMELKTLPSELYERMSKEQQGVFQELKKHYKRLNYKNNG